MADRDEPRSLVWIPEPWSHDDVDDVVADFRLWYPGAYRFTATQDYLDGPGGRWDPNRSVSLRSKRVPRGAAFVLYCPDWQMLARGVRLTGSGSAAVFVERVGVDLVGWARATGAVDGRTGQRAPALDPETRELADRLRVAGNNDFDARYGAPRARTLIERAYAAGTLSRDVLGAVAALGQGWRGLERLDEMVSKCLPSKLLTEGDLW